MGLLDLNLLLHGKILVIDDEIANIQLLEKILTRAGYENVSVTTDSRRVMSMIADDDPDLVLLDLHMPHLDGYAILALLRKNIAPVSLLPVIVLTADITPQAKHRALDGGAIDFLSKPFDHAEVLLRVRNALHTRFLHRQLKNENAVLEERVKTSTELLAQSVKGVEQTQQPIRLDR